jgi:hypothetical protein
MSWVGLGVGRTGRKMVGWEVYFYGVFCFMSVFLLCPYFIRLCFLLSPMFLVLMFLLRGRHEFPFFISFPFLRFYFILKYGNQRGNFNGSRSFVFI